MPWGSLLIPGLPRSVRFLQGGGFYSRRVGGVYRGLLGIVEESKHGGYPVASEVACSKAASASAFIS
jgi:hypothetical protein